MTRLAKGYSIGNFISQVGITLHRFGMVSMKIFGSTTFLADIIVALEYLASPVFVLPRPVVGAVTVRVFAGCCIAMLLTAMLRFFAVALWEFFVAIFTDENGGSAGLSSAFCASDYCLRGTGGEFLATEHAGMYSALATILLMG